MPRLDLKIRTGIELLLLAAFTVAFLLLFPRRNTFVDISLAFLALLLIALNAGYTRTAIWSRFPSEVPERERLKRCLGIVLPVTALLLLACLGVGLYIGYRKAGWQGAVTRVDNWHIVPALAFYFPWALLQQTLFQFYLLGRLLTIFPAWLAVGLTGIFYALVHLPDLGITAATIAAGIFWTCMYYRYRRLVPLAFSHACLGAAFHYWIYGLDLAKEWQLIVK